MTDEERQKLVADLREFTGLDNEPWLVRVGRDAANEIERLAESLKACHGYADECMAKIKFLSDQIDSIERRIAW